MNKIDFWIFRPLSFYKILVNLTSGWIYLHNSIKLNIFNNSIFPVITEVNIKTAGKIKKNHLI